MYIYIYENNLLSLYEPVSVHCSEETPKKRSILTAATQAYVEESDDTIEEVLLIVTGFPQALEITENLENHEKKFHAWKNHGISKT